MPPSRAETVPRYLELFAAQVARAPHALALSDGERSYTYAELDRAANRISQALVTRRRAEQQPVAVLLGHTAEAVVTLLAITKAGEIRLALDQYAPPVHLGEILGHSGATVVVTDGAHRPALAGLGGLDVLELGALGDLPDTPPKVETGTDGLHDLTYTSGSTDRPKAIAFGERETVAAALMLGPLFGYTSEDRMSLTAGLSFAAARALDRALLRGSSVHVFDLASHGPAELARWLRAERITYFNAMTSTLRALLEELASAPGLPSLHTVVTGGEPLYRRDVELIRERIGDCRIAFGYGLSESAYTCALVIPPGASVDDDVLSAGAPPEQVELWLDDVGDDGIGEIMVRSRYLARGYWRDPQLTSAAFTQDPYVVDLRTLRTGDVGRLRTDGTLEVLGRKDDRVKIRGYSVEVAAVEHALLGLPEIASAVVKRADDDFGDGRLVAYFVASDPRNKPTANALRRRLLEALPPYMVPAAFAAKDELPTTPTGKINRRALPGWPPHRPHLEETYEPAREQLERALVRIWQELLSVYPVGIHDDFYLLGGDSLSAAEATAKLNALLGVDLPLLLYAGERVTIEGIASQVRKRDSELFLGAVPLQPEGAAPPFFCVGGGGGEAYHLRELALALAPDQPLYALQPIGRRSDWLRRSIRGLAEHHIEHMLAVQPEGPHLIGAYSGGGITAFEMARQLDARGIPPALLVLIDSYSPTLEQHPPIRVRRTLRAHLHLGTRLRAIAFPLLAFLGWPIPVPRREEFRLETIRAATRRYRAEPYGGPALLFRSDQHWARMPADNGWRALLPELEVVVLPASHLTMIRPPHVDGVAECLREVLSRALGREGPELQPAAAELSV